MFRNVSNLNFGCLRPVACVRSRVRLPDNGSVVNRVNPIQVQLNRVTNQCESGWQTGFGYLLGLFFEPENVGDIFLRDIS
jgi:hypothetical protein